MTQVTGTTAIIVDFVCLIAALIFVGLRLYVRLRILHLSIFNLQDALVIFAWLCFVANVVQDVIDNAYGLWIPEIVLTAKGPPAIEDYISNPDHLRLVLQGSWAVAWVYYFVVYSVKAVLLLTYLELFPERMVNLRRTLYFTIVLVIIGFILSLGLNLFWCYPIGKNWALLQRDRCLSWSSVTPYVTSVGFHIITDMIVYALPFCLIPMLARTATWSQIGGVSFMFSLGLISIICVVVRTAMVGASCTFQFMACWGAAEQASAVIISCCLPLRYLRSQAHTPAVARPRKEKRRQRNTMEDVEAGAVPLEKSSKKDSPVSSAGGNRVAERSPESCVRDWTAGSIEEASANRASEIGGLGPRKASMSHCAELDFIEENESWNVGNYTEEQQSKATEPVIQDEPKRKGKKEKDLMIMTFGGHDNESRRHSKRHSYSEADADNKAKASPMTPRFNGRRESNIGLVTPTVLEEDMNASPTSRFSISSFGRRLAKG